jgi:hypothetical protein
MRVSMSGSASLEDNSFDLNGGWQDVQWPLTGEPVVSSTTGEFSADGSMDNYHFKVFTNLSGKATYQVRQPIR